MKYILILCDGMADEPVPALGGKTPMEYAEKPHMDALAAVSEVGMVRTVPIGMHPGSDTANLSVLGYDPQRFYSGRSPLEALSIGVDMEETDIAVRCNLVTLTENGGGFREQRILDHSAGEIPTAEAAVFLDAVRKRFENEEFRFYLGTSYRHLLIWKHGRLVPMTGPHDVLTQPVAGHLPGEPKLVRMMEESYDLLKDHPANIERKKAGKNPANAIWFWGAGTRPALAPFYDIHHKKGAIISAVDLLKGIAVGASMEVIKVEGANGGLHTNYKGKGEAAVKALLEDGMDFVYIHVEATDEMGHQGKPDKKAEALGYIDRDILGPVKEAMDQSGEDYRILILPDHPTPVRIRTHTADPVPYLLYDSRTPKTGTGIYSEEAGRSTGIMIEKGCDLMGHLFDA